MAIDREIRRRVDSLARDERGASAVEFAMVLPFLMMLLLGIIQYGSLFVLQREMHDTARETARGMIIGAFESESDAERFAVAQLAGWSAHFSAEAAYPDPPDHDVAVTIRVPMAEAALINLLGFGMDGELAAEVHMFRE